MEEVSNSVVSHIDGGIRKRFDKELGVARKTSTQTEVSGYTPFLEPFNSFFEALEDTVMVGVEVGRLDVVQDSVLPVFLAVLQVPLVDE